MRNNFKNGLIFGSIIGASIGTIMNKNTHQNTRNRRMLNTSRRALKKSSYIIQEIISLLK